MRANRVGLLAALALVSLSGCAQELIRAVNRTPCDGLPRLPREDCLIRRGEKPFPLTTAYEQRRNSTTASL